MVDAGQSDTQLENSAIQEEGLDIEGWGDYPSTIS